ncbi:putative F-box/LRR-repeat protein [Senna tora]|uniref:Putative F-box/LRR-repeat protein n=1 Tax=Senna tora TaxID=362788 RepID=A0A834TFN3_9FABA|nr:putative F-box/LRR-repeat protein [Senna tora]
MDNHHTPHVDKFRLKFSEPSRSWDAVLRAVSFALQRGVRELELDFSSAAPNNTDRHALFRLPGHVLGGSSGKNNNLEKLRLFSCGFLNMGDLLGVGQFVGLKDVFFGGVGLRTCELKSLLRQCRGIERLGLSKCWGLADFDMVGDEEEEGLILMGRVRELVIDECEFDHMGFLSFKAPNLKVFKYCGGVCFSEIEVKPGVMEEAHLDFAHEFDLDFGDALYKLMLDLYPVRVLTVCSYFLQVIPNGDEAVRMEYDMNVRHLILNTALHSNEFCGISFLLNSCPYLHTLTIDLTPPHRLFYDYEAPYSFDGKRFWAEHAIDYKCVRRSLKVVEVRGFRGTWDELMVVSYLVHYGRVLHNIHIYPLIEQDDHDGQKLQRYRFNANFFSTREKASKKLKITIY